MVIWHVDDLKISHVEKDMVEAILKYLGNRFGKDRLLTMTRGKVLEYLGMTLDYREKGKVRMSMFECINEMLEELPRDTSS